MEKIRTLVVDDEKLARKNITALLKKDPDISLIGECANGQDALEAIKSKEPDLLILDIQMPQRNGFELLKELEEDKIPVVIFVTAFAQYALRAFEACALDYLLKPFDDQRFARAIARAKKQILQGNVKDLTQRLVSYLQGPAKEGETLEKRISPTTKDKRYLSRIVIKSVGSIYFIKVDEIDWIEAADYYVRFHVGNKSHLMRKTLNELEKQLNPQTFLRIHRGTIVNIEQIRELKPYFNGEYIVILNNGKKLKLSRTYRQKLKKIIGGIL